MREQMKYTRQNGFSILEVLIGIFIFVVGLLALSALQGALTRSMADAKVRTTAVNIAEFTIESNRNFRHLQADGLPKTDPLDVFAYGDIVSDPDTIVGVNGMNYTVAVDVTDYYYQLVTDSYTATEPTGLVPPPPSDYKQVEVTVSWDAAQNFRGDEGTELTAADLGTGSVKLTSVIPAIISSASARIADADENDGVAPTISYTPGLNPDVVALSLGDSKFKESLLPEPDVQRANELVQTTFDVVTYSTVNGNTFLRREEFASVSCECTLRAASADNLGRRPVIWAGDEYAAGHLVQKPYGESANNKNSSLCDSCCKDHHDGGSATEDSADSYANVYGPFRIDTGNDKEYTGGARTSDHKHYKENGSIAGNGNTYLEACRLVRVDGFFRVAQDFRREDQYVFPADFLDDAAEIATYSSYVTTAAVAYENDVSNGYPTNSPPCIGGTNPSCVASPSMQGGYPAAIASGELPTWTALQTGVTDEQQLRSRGIYIDYLSNDLRLFMAQCFDGNGDLINDCCIRNAAVANGCTADDLYIDKTPTTNLLEMLPFYEVQLTKLENWDQTDRNPLTIALANEAIEDGNAHDRGIAAQYKTSNNQPIILGATNVMSNSHRGNIGFTNTLAIDPEFDNQLEEAYLQVQSLDASGNGSVATGDPVIRIEGSFSESATGDPTIAVVGGGEAFCGLKPGGYWCNVATTATAPTITVYGYEDTHVLIPDLDPPDVTEIRCAVSVPLFEISASAADTTFSLLIGGTGAIHPPDTDYDISIVTTCGGGGIGT